MYLRDPKFEPVLQTLSDALLCVVVLWSSLWLSLWLYMRLSLLKSVWSSLWLSLCHKVCGSLWGLLYAGICGCVHVVVFLVVFLVNFVVVFVIFDVTDIIWASTDHFLYRQTWKKRTLQTPWSSTFFWIFCQIGLFFRQFWILERANKK